MLQRLNAEIAECYVCAHEARLRADMTNDAGLKQEYLEMEQRWLTMARRYEFAQRLSDFTGEVERRRPIE
jgi:hypothetical protein